MKFDIKLMAFAAQIFLIWLIVRGGISVDREWMLVRYNSAAKALSFLFLIFCTWLVYSAMMEEGVSKGVYLVLYCLMGLALLNLNEVYRRKIWFDEQTIHYQSPYGKRLSLPFSNIASKRNVWFGSACRVNGFDGQKIDCSYYMAGSDDFCAIVSSILDKRIT
jgi:hypothetical protein